MGKASSAKSKDARAERKAEQRRLADGCRLVATANTSSAADLEAAGGELLHFSLDELQLQITCARGVDLAPDVLAWAIDLTERNMNKLYEDCAWGWNLRKKTEEMKDESAWYLVVAPPAAPTETEPPPAATQPVAFTHFRFDMDYGIPVLYCYELQVEATRRGRGVGARLLRVLERVARAMRMRRVRLTALRHNPRAATFFRACGYTTDETSPEAQEAAHYEILSKLTADTVPDSEEAQLAGDLDTIRIHNS